MGNRLAAVRCGLILLALASLSQGREAQAQTPLGGGWTAGGSVRTRQEVWDWFEAPGFDNSYTYNGTIFRLAASGPLAARPQVDASVELASPFLLGLPDDAFAPAPQGALGLGALYRGNNGSRQGSLFLKQGWLRVRDIGARQTYLRAGRFEFGEGRERTPPDPSLAWVKSQRVADRLIGTFAWTHIGRSFDGVEYARPRTRDNLTAVLAYPTRGVFDLNGSPTLTSVRFGYLGYTLGSIADARSPYEWRLFGILYEDVRTGVVKTDNRSVDARNADREPIRLATLGAHYLRAWNTKGGKADALLWGAVQGGDWGQQDAGSYAFALEAGWQPKGVAWSPWLRAGYNHYSGDGDPNDGDHGTFYPMLDTPRIYARTPFYTLANARDAFIMLTAKPSPKVSIRTDYHWVRLDSGSDLWYAADGPFQSGPRFAPSDFGLLGRPAGGRRGVANLWDVSLDYAASAKAGYSLYLGWMNNGGSVVRAIYPNDADGFFAYGEATLKF